MPTRARRPVLPRPPAATLTALAVATAATLAACSGPPRVFDRSTSPADALVGMSRSDILACAGRPDSTRLRGGVETLVYGEGASPEGSPYIYSDSTRGGGITGGIAGDSPIAQGLRNAYCEVVFEIADGRVIDARYRSATGSLTGSPGVCATIVDSCLARRATPSADPLEGATTIE